MKQRLNPSCILRGVFAAALCLTVFVAAAEDVPPKPAVKTGDEPNPLSATKPVLPLIVEADFERVPFAPTSRFPWLDKPPAAKPTPSKAKPDPAKPAGASDTSADMTSGDLIIRSFGVFTREQRTDHTPAGDKEKEVITCTKDVEIEMIESQSVLRGDKVIIVKDMETDVTELIDARGHVEFVNPDQKGKGEMLRLEVQQVNGETVKDEFVLVGNPTSGKKAVLWLPTQTFEAVRFVRDSVKNTFRASGTPVMNKIDNPEALKVTNAPPDPSGAAKKPASKDSAKAGADPKTSATAGAKDPKAPGSGTSSSGLSLAGGNVSIESEGEMNFEGASGKFKIAHNVTIIKTTDDPAEATHIVCDDAIVTMDVPPPGVAAPGGTNSMTGEMKVLECFGRVEIKTGARTIFCDKMTMDNDKHSVYMEMLNPIDKVYIFNQTVTDGGESMIVPKWLKQDTLTEEMEAGGSMKQGSWSMPLPSVRGNGPRPEDAKPLLDPKSKARAAANPAAGSAQSSKAPAAPTAKTQPGANTGGEAVPVQAKK